MVAASSCARPLQPQPGTQAVASHPIERLLRWSGQVDPAVTPPERLESPLCKGDLDPGPAPLRRLTRFEYNNTIADLLDDASHPADDFPTEEKRDGFDNNAEALTVSPLLGEQYLLTAERLAAAYMDRRDDARLAMAHSCNLSSTQGEDTCAERFLAAISRRAYRRPAPEEDMRTLLTIYATGKRLGAGATGEKPFRNGLRLALTAILLSPRFLYRMEEGAPAKPGADTVVRLDPWETAARLSYLIWAAAPDEPLLAAAEKDALRTREEIGAQVRRMLGAPRAHAMVARFHEQWLELDRIGATEKEAQAFPRFNKGIAALMREETDRFLDHVVWEGGGSIEDILTAPYTFIESNLASFYGLGPLDLPRTKEGILQNRFLRVTLDGQKRGGILTQGTFMAGLANANQTSPVKRGLFIRERLLCEDLPPPPPNAMIELPPLDPKLTTRERFQDHTLDAGCAGCHKRMDPIGLGFENFDGAGLWRDTENDQPVDASGEVRGWGDGQFVGGMALARRLAASDEVRACVSRRWFEYAHGRELQVDGSAGDACSFDVVRRRFGAAGHKIKDLITALTETDAFLYKRVTAAGGSR